MICKVIDTIEKNSLLTGVSSVCVGVSGGADSMCLLHILSKLKEKYGIILKVVHINHNLRGEEAERDQNLVKEYCRNNGLDFTVFSEDIKSLSAEMGVGEEECGRIVRYRCFKEMNCDAVAVAHTLSDSAETFVYNLLRGSGIKGLTSIPVKRDNIIRPLINCSREEIEDYCHKENIAYITDSSNLTDDYTRNYIRHNIIPAFERVNGAYLKNISNAVNILKENDAFIKKCSYELINKAQCNNKTYSLKALRDADAAVLRNVCYILLSDNMNKSPEYKHIELLSSIISQGNGKLEIAKDFYAYAENDLLKFGYKEQKNNDYWESDYLNSKFVSPYAEYRLISSEEKEGICFDGEKVKEALTLTSRRIGDVFFLKNRKIKKSLKKLFNEMKIPVEERSKIAVLRCGEEIIWVEGIGVNGYFLPDKNTKKYIIIKKEVQSDAE